MSKKIVLTENDLKIVTIPPVYGEYTEFTKVQRHYDMVKIHLSKKLQNGEKIKVAFYVLFDYVFQSKTLYKLMLKDDMFDPFIVVIPNANKYFLQKKDNDTLYVSLDTQSLLEKMHKTYVSLSREFEHVHKAYTKETGFIDFASKADLICFNNVYDHITHELYTMKYAIKARVLPFMMSYGFYPDYYARNNIINLASFNSAWKIFSDTKESLLELHKYTDAQGKNAVLTGYGKMDALAHSELTPRMRKRIIIAPHHTIDTAHQYALSNFLEYAPLFLDLPKRYPDIDFVFRPHPFLFETPNTSKGWSYEDTSEYLTKMTSFSNVEYQDGGDYFETFANSDALIHDCGSFIAEYLYTDKPACFMVKNKEALPNIFTKLGLDCINQHELAYTPGDVIKFIDEVVIKGIDTKKEERINYANKYLKINYPHASNKILEHIKQELGQDLCENNAK